MKPLRRGSLFIVTLLAFVWPSASATEPPPDTYVIVELEYDTGKVTDAHLTKSTGDPALDKATLEKFRKWRFKPKKVHRVKIPILYVDHAK